MYAHYFGLKENPFTITPNPRYLYLSARHAEALAHLVYGVTESGGFIQLTGEVGTGKTTLIRSLLEQLPEHADIALIVNPKMALTEFLRAICRELGVPLEANLSSADITHKLNAHLLDAHARGRRVVLIVDEAQGLSADLLEQIRLLTNLETESTKLMQIILVGQPELREVLAQRELRQLAQRVTGRYHLTPLNAAETGAYVNHRLEVAGAAGSIFTPRALRQLYRLSGGIPRLINILADRTLLGAYAAQRRQCNARLVRRAAHEALDTPPRPRGWMATAAALVAVTVALAGLVVYEHPLAAAPTAAADPPATRQTDALAQWLTQSGAAADTDGAFATLFSLWGATYAADSGTPACRQADKSGLRCLYQHASWQDLVAYDRPAILTLTLPDGSEYQAVISGLSGGLVTLTAGTRTRTFPLAALRRDWNGEFLLLWQPPPHSDGVLHEGMSGPAVAWLDQQLAKVDGGSLPGNGLAYNAALADAVRQFQKTRGLQVDGIAGEQTLIELNSVLNRAGIPRLTKGLTKGSS
ncbi:MAG TPA: AAA family ATPase [Gammaproteobacteria bacterium]|nr:AAA family ATPase [Gammaproteobacteria bacterium]